MECGSLRGAMRGLVRGTVSVFSGLKERPTVVTSDPQRGVGLDQTPLRVLATTALRRRTSATVDALRAECNFPASTDVESVVVTFGDAQHPPAPCPGHNQCGTTWRGTGRPGGSPWMI